MKNKELIQQRLVEQGVPKELAKCNCNFLSKLIFLEEKPLVFQSPYKMFFKQALVSGIVWGILMWIMFWHSVPENWVVQVLSSLFFGCFMGGFLSCRIVKHRKKLGNVSWEKWCSIHCESVP